MNIRKFMYTTEFMTGAFLAFVLTTLFFTVILTQCFTSNDLLKHSGFYRDGKLYECRPKR
jgi:hypothetical protein